MTTSLDAKPKRALVGQLARFLASGAANSGLTFLLYELLHLVVPYRVAFTVSFAVGIAFVAVVNTRFVFARVPVTESVTRLGAFYVVSYILSLGVLTILVERLSVPSAFAPIGVVIIMMPINFFGSRAIVNRAIRRKNLSCDQEPAPLLTNREREDQR